MSARTGTRGASKVTVTLDGPFFENDPEKTFEHNVQDALERLAAAGEREVRIQIESHRGQMPHWTGHSLAHVVGRVASVSGRTWHRHAVVSESTAGMDAREAIRTKAAAASIERRWHPYARVARSERLLRPVLQADLAKGLE